LEVQLLVAPGCPNADGTRHLMAECIDQLGLSVAVRERVGEYPSPTILVDGVDVMTGTLAVERMQACRLDVPTRPHLLSALGGGSPDGSEGRGSRDE
jgi:hypothetical protein